jgi:ubiquinone/menaquinone biosynthesis C-methylase UbiE
MGCSVGHSTVPYAEAYPDAEVHGIDVAAPMLRYAHVRAEALGQRVHFSQQNAERTQFPDGSFDLVVSHILLHEMPVFAIRNVLRESYRLLAPGGRMIHLEGALYQNMDPFRAFLYDWETANNNEPFWSAMRDLDLKQLASEAGFAADPIEMKFIQNGVWKAKLTAQSQSETNRKPGIGSRGTWLILSAQKT